MNSKIDREPVESNEYSGNMLSFAGPVKMLAVAFCTYCRVETELTPMYNGLQ